MTQKSTQCANRAAVPQTFNASNMDGIIHGFWFSGVVATADALAVGTLIHLGYLPAGSRFLDGYWYNDGTFAGAGVTIDIGNAADTDLYADGIDVSAECWTYFPASAAIAGLVTEAKRVVTEETLVYATTIGDVIVDTGVYRGFIRYMI